MARGIVPAVVLPKRSMLMMTLSSGIFSRSAVAMMMRRFAWCAMKQSTSLPVRPFVSQDALGHLRHFLNRVLEDLLAILMNIVHFLVDGFMRRWVQAAARRHVQVLSARALDLRTWSMIPGSPSSAGSSSTAPAPSPKMMHTARSL